MDRLTKLLERLSMKTLYAEIPAYHKEHRAWVRIARAPVTIRAGVRHIPDWKYKIGIIEFPEEYIRGKWEEDMDVTSSEATEYIVTTVQTDDAFLWIVSQWIDDESRFMDKRASQCPW
jgi:hypothetical protein